MGTPVITVAEQRFASLHSTSHLANAGLNEFIARDFDEYVAIAQAYARDLNKLSQLSAGLRTQVSTSPLCDGPRYAESFQKFLRDIWASYCEQDQDE